MVHLPSCSRLNSPLPCIGLFWPGRREAPRRRSCPSHPSAYRRAIHHAINEEACPPRIFTDAHRCEFGSDRSVFIRVHLWQVQPRTHGPPNSPPIRFALADVAQLIDLPFPRCQNVTDHGDRGVDFDFRTDCAEVSRASDGSANLRPGRICHSSRWLRFSWRWVSLKVLAVLFCSESINLRVNSLHRSETNHALDVFVGDRIVSAFVGQFCSGGNVAHVFDEDSAAILHEFKKKSAPSTTGLHLHLACAVRDILACISASPIVFLLNQLDG